MPILINKCSFMVSKCRSAPTWQQSTMFEPMQNKFNPHKIQIPQNDFLSLLSEQESFVFIKNNLSQYQYANQLFLDLMGLDTVQKLFNQTDYEFCRDKARVKIYLQHDEEVLETEKILSVNEEILPQKHKLLIKQVTGKIYPVFSEDSSKPVAVMGIVKPHYLPFKLTLETAVGMSAAQMNDNFIKRSYDVVVFNKKITLSKREVQCIIELLKGKTAGEIAHTFKLKQSTIEFYLENIKNKLGATSKSSLIMTVFSQKIIQQIIL